MQLETRLSPTGIIESAQTINSTVWKQVAAAAWSFFQPGIGVDSNTGLPYGGGKSFPDFTDWDLGVYIQTVIDAQKIGLISATGAWGANDRIDKVLTFLETRPLNDTTHYPFWFYDATTGQDDHLESDNSTAVVDIVDTGVLFVALNNLRVFDSTYAEQVNNIVLNESANQNGGSNYAALLPNIVSTADSNSIYAYLFTSGFASFWPSDKLCSHRYSKQHHKFAASYKPLRQRHVAGAPVTCDPLLLSVFNLNDSNELSGYMNQVYLAHEAYYNATNNYVAFSEGNSQENGYIYEWVVAPNGSMWQVTNEAQTVYYTSDIIIYTKVAFSFLALIQLDFCKKHGCLP